MDLDVYWQDYGLDRLEEGMRTLFPAETLSLEHLMAQVMQGDVAGAARDLFKGLTADLSSQFSGMRNVFLWLLVLGIVSSLMTHFVEIFDQHQVAEVGFYFMYLLFTVVLLRCFFLAAETAAAALDNVILFIRLMIPAYLISLGLSTGAATAAATTQLMLLVIYGIQNILSGWLVPLTSACVCLW